MKQGSKKKLQLIQGLIEKRQTELLLYFLFFISNSLNLLFQISNKNGLYLLLMLLTLALLTFQLVKSNYLYSSKERFRLFLLFSFYQLLSLFVGFSLNIPDIDREYFFTELYPVFQLNYLSPIIFIFTVMFLILNWKEQIEHTFKLKNYIAKIDEQFILSQFFLSFIVCDTKFIRVVLDSQFLLAGEKNISFSFLVNYIILYLLLTISSYYFIKGIGKLIRNDIGMSSTWSMSLILALIFNYCLQFSIRSTDYFVSLFELQLAAFLFQVLTISVLFLLTYLVVNRFLFSTLVIILFSVIFTIANSLKYEMRQEPILPSDLSWMKQIFLVFSFIDIGFILSILVGIGLITLFFYYLRGRLWVGKPFLKWKERSIIIVIVSSILVGTMSSINSLGQGKDLNIPIISTLYKTIDIDWLGNTVNANVKSLSYVWMKQMVTSVMKKPLGYSREKINEIEEKYISIAEDINKNRKNNIGEQTVIFLLSESFSQPDRIPGTKLSRELTPFINSLQANFPNGLMLSDGYGGGTANMEFQSLTGLAMYNMSPSVSTIYTEIATSMRFIPSISDLFPTSDRIAIHLESGNNYSRNIIYKKLEFDRFIGTSNTDTIAKDIEKEGLYPSDATTYQYVLDSLNDKPQFYSVITMQNHVPWSAGLPEDISVTNSEFNSKENESLTSYGRLLNRTDEATQNFFNKLSELDEKITVVFYGDHLPGLYKSENFEEDPTLQYKTDYFIWSNFATANKDWSLLRANDFIAALLETTNSKVSPYYALLTQVMNYSTIEEEQWPEEAREVMEDFKIVEYDLLKSKGYLSKDSEFFKIGD
ncbi:TPA: sulfatase-like hydrolase/transferase [Streptococcus suis]|nr:sulfatase-like hydrolase/transferase [Streptococcus suis]HEM3627343.1 sulfatase-like hydrolase/transferase [Streptococcus suis]HEM3631956.1 sulfatase-like hydrolase/transferase [Streptococcus suis]HEM3640404.1 sulfatase-like hydrolase/transferase [Streptococcus suis]HEM3652513.1 sulfatase-like hydrolase/transferase [Streptococcus suis]